MVYRMRRCASLEMGRRIPEPPRTAVYPHGIDSQATFLQQTSRYWFGTHQSTRIRRREPRAHYAKVLSGWTLSAVTGIQSPSHVRYESAQPRHLLFPMTVLMMMNRAIIGIIMRMSTEKRSCVSNKDKTKNEYDNIEKSNTPGTTMIERGGDNSSSLSSIPWATDLLASTQRVHNANSRSSGIRNRTLAARTR